MRLHGHCLCGGCRFTLKGVASWVGHCHCESCRRATASPFTTWIGQANGRWTLTGESLRTYDSSPGQQRGFCGTCGTPMFYKSANWPNETHFYAALLEDATQVSPTTQYHTDEQLPWIDIAHS